MVIMPAKFAADFEVFCRKNPGPCPLLAVVPAGASSNPARKPTRVRVRWCVLRACGG
jgi:uncharacterized protein YcsI (UPF0317 family)